MKGLRLPGGAGLLARFMVASCLLLALLSPSLPGPRIELQLAVLLDDSLSMPAEFVESTWREISLLSSALPAKSAVSVARFADRVVPEALAEGEIAELPRSAALDRRVTDIAGALREAVFHLPPGRSSALLLASDGAATRGDTGIALRQLRDVGIPVYSMSPASGGGAGHPWLAELDAPQRVAMGQDVRLQLRLRGTAGDMVSLSLLEDGQQLLQRELSLPAGGEQVSVFSWRPLRPGITLLTVRIDGEPGVGARGPRQLTRAVNVAGPLPALYLGVLPAVNPLAASLRRTQPPPTFMTPIQFSGRRTAAAAAGAIVLDDVAIADMSDGAWQAIADAVSVQGVGLLVLGGGNSFGAGAYRHSLLESLLPVTAQADQPQQRAAVLFLLDRSGSMGERQAGPSRLAVGRRAVAVAADQLQAGDLLGVTLFAADVDIRLPLSPAPLDPSGALAVGAGGGTRLEPALRSALQQLSRVAVGQRLLVLATDGFAGDEDLSSVARDLAQAGVTVIALAVGDGPELSALQQLTGFNDGRLLRVADIARLPRLMAAGVAARRAAEVRGPSPVLLRQPPPFLAPPDSGWPPVAAYAASKLRPGADLYLQSDSAEPLLAAGFAGAGRVAVLPAGIGRWASAWNSWPAAEEFSAGLVHWLARGQGSGDLWLTIAEQPGQLQVLVEHRQAGAWGSRVPRLVLRGPGDEVIEVALEQRAPGRFRATVEADRVGLYIATVQGGGQQAQYGYYRDAGADYVAPELVAQRWQQWHRSQLLRPWLGVEALVAGLPRSAGSARGPLVALALLGYLLLLLWERGLMGQFWPKA